MKKYILVLVLFCSSMGYGQKYGVDYFLSISEGPTCNDIGVIDISLDLGVSVRSYCNTQLGSEPDSKSGYFETNNIPSVISSLFLEFGDGKTEIFESNLGYCGGSFSSSTNFFGYGSGSFTFTSYPIIGLLIPTNNPSNIAFISADELGFDSAIYNWEFKTSDGNWDALPSKFQGKSNFQISLVDIFGINAYKYENQTIQFRIKYCSGYTNIVSFRFIPSSPNLTNTSFPNYTTCAYTNGEVVFTFDRALVAGEKYLFTRNPVGANIITSHYSDQTEYIEKISDTQYKWKDIPEGKYNFKYQTQLDTNSPSAFVVGADFEIVAKPKLQYTLNPIQPACSTDKGSLEIRVSGGTPPYRIYKDNQDVTPVPVNGVYTLYGLDAKEYSIKVTDSNGCIEN